MSEKNVQETLPPLKAEARDLNFHYGSFQALKGINMPIYEKQVTSLIGPSGCGKSTYLRCFNRMHDLYPGNRYDGVIEFHPDRKNLLSETVDPIEVRMRISMVFQKPNPFPKSIYENVAYGLRVRGETARSVLDDKVEAALRGAALCGEVKDWLKGPSANLSGGQQQRRAEGNGDDPDRDAQHATGDAHFGLHYSLVSRRDGRVRRDRSGFHQAQAQRDRGLHYRAFRLDAARSGCAQAGFSGC